MLVIQHILYLLATPLIFAYPQITNPKAGASIPGSAAFTVSWVESGDPPLIVDLSSYELNLYTGTNADPQKLYAITNGVFNTDNSISISIPLAIGAPITNAYFIGLISSSTGGSIITSFSDRFTLTGMTGTFSAAVLSDLRQVSGILGPETVREVTDSPSQNNSPPDIAWEIPYTLQSGLTKFAPMPPIPPTAITATDLKALWPSSSVELAKTLMPIPTQVVTLSQSQTFSVSSHTNTAAPAPQPTINM